ncbi:GntR family transcriptional regulator [Ornithinicoccus hortensis]|uniref:DNA-binding GntR family transcriptional regulator n=1 Tax=Ornithinicoccus hortensis TaxID=82346 RepID=A0A542YLV9_9MICO|nr:GntR family transcriptional regulator [Ornithinicoccus hortensis]TQL49076.1 DNA-binding GntR family transcriptional regulator [Ornithinicoccus hortensis]
MSVETVDQQYVSLADRAYVELRDRLILLDIAPGSAINEGRLAGELGIGRTPIREALKRLELDHLVASFPRRGTFATRVDITDLADISELRTLLEPVAAARAARTAGPAVRAELLARAEQIAAIDPRAVEHRDLMHYDLEVHRLVYRAAGNPHLAETLIRSDNLATRIWCLVIDRLPNVAEHVVEHADLLRAIADGDADRASDLAARHVRDFEEQIRAVL